MLLYDVYPNFIFGSFVELKKELNLQLNTKCLDQLSESSYNKIAGILFRYNGRLSKISIT